MSSLRALLSSRGAIAVGLVATAAIAAGGWRLSAGPAVQAYAVERADLLQTVVASGHVESPRRVEVGSSLTGTVAAVPVREGQHVRAGQLLVALDPAEARAALEQARANLDQARARLVQIHGTALPVADESLRQAELNHANAQRTLERQQDLFNKGFIGQAALDEAQRARDVSLSLVKAARLQRESQAPGGNDDRLARTAVDQARAALAVAQARFDNTTLEAPVAGVLISRKVEVGAVVMPGKALMLLSPDGATELVVQIDEKNLSLLRVGQPALASADAYPDRHFEARVAYINPGVDASRGSVEVKLAVAEPPAFLLQDMTVSVDIEVARVKAALALPADAIHEGDWVLVARAGRVQRQPVKVGARGAGRVQVVEGLNEGELVLPTPGTTLHEGAAVRAVAMSQRAARRT